MRNTIIDIRPLLPKNPPGGVPKYTKEITRAMFGIIDAEKVDARFFLFSSGTQKPDLDFLKKHEKLFHAVHLSVPNRVLNASFKLFNYPKIDTFIRKLQATSYKLQNFVFFAPNINLFPLSHKTKLVVTFHDLSFERYPWFLTRKDWVWHKAVNPCAIAKRADKIIAVSESTKQDLIRLYGIESSKIKVIYSGLKTQNPKPKTQNYKPKVKSILYVGSTEGRKNIEVLRQAFDLVQKRLRGEKLKLIIAGPPHNPVSEKEKRELYQGASLFVYPSLFEGFGLPPLEAMRYGVPVITGNTSSLPEVMGDAALMVNPHRIDELATAIEILLTDEKLRMHYAKKGLARARQFTWEKAARETLEVLLSV